MEKKKEIITLRRRASRELRGKKRGGEQGKG